jgi:hypothetical protein
MSINAYKYYEDNFKKEKIVDKFLQSI